MVSVRGEKGQRPLAMLAKQARKSGAGFPASGLSHDTGTLLLLVVVEMSRGRALEVGAAGGRGGLCAGGGKVSGVGARVDVPDCRRRRGR